MSDDKKIGAYRCNVCGGPVGPNDALKHLHLDRMGLVNIDEEYKKSLERIAALEKELLFNQEQRQMLIKKVAMIEKEQEIRPAVMRFAQLMEKKLRANDYKEGWEKCPDESLMRLLRDEVEELEEALHISCPHCGQKMTPAFGENVLSETADVANFAMMIADNYTTKNEEHRGKKNEQ
jgi:DNA-directed RNA polymerase subunit RPC12/RpoP